MRPIKFWLAFVFTCLFTLNILRAQQGVLSAGGNAAGVGGSISYSIGQLDFLSYSSEHGSLNFGLQHPFIDLLPPIFEIPDILVGDGQTICFDASETVIVAGNGKYFIVSSGGHAEIIAGFNVILKPGALVEQGGYLKAWISDTWCDLPETILASSETEIQPSESEFTSICHENFFTVFPNPTTGRFTVDFAEINDSMVLSISVFSLMGQIIMSVELPTAKKVSIHLPDIHPGIYLIKVVDHKKMGAARLIKQ